MKASFATLFGPDPTRPVEIFSFENYKVCMKIREFTIFSQVCVGKNLIWS